MYKTELYHHGIKGQKWGIRRFQNKDGTLTTLGKKKYTTSTFSARRHESAANKSYRDAADLRKHGYVEEANAVKKVADKHMARAKSLDNKAKTKKVYKQGVRASNAAYDAMSYQVFFHPTSYILSSKQGQKYTQMVQQYAYVTRLSDIARADYHKAEKVDKLIKKSDMSYEEAKAYVYGSNKSNKK